MDANVYYPFKLASVVAPVHKIMFDEEQTTLNPAESWDGQGSVVNDGRMAVGGAVGAYDGDSITMRHNKKGDVCYADGHVGSLLALPYSRQDSWQHGDVTGQYFFYLDPLHAP